MKKNFKLILALVLSLMMVTMAVTASAVTISITRDSSYGSGSGEGNVYTYYKMFDAIVSSGTSFTNASGHTNGTPNTASGTTSGVSYKTNTEIWNAIATAQADAGNAYFESSAIAGDSAHVNVAWKQGVSQTSENIIAAASLLKTVADGGKYLATGDVANNSTGWSVDVTAGYYLIVGAAGNNLIAATTDINIAEKNEYPSLDKTQADEDAPVQSNADRSAAVGDVLTYEVDVTIPNTVKNDDTILVWDKKTDGLTYNNNVSVKTAVDGTSVAPAATGVDGAVWTQVITITNAAQAAGKHVVFTCTMTVNSSALVDTGRKNEAGLKYGNSGTYKYDSLPDEVEYDTYFTGIHKYDADNSGTDLNGVTFKLEECFSGTWAEFPVSLSGTYYIYDAGGSSTITTSGTGMVYIRGIDGNKTYRVTELTTLDGYNLLSNTVDLPKTLDDGSGTAFATAVADKAGATWAQIANSKGTLLPSTGGIGTTIFYIGGSILVLAAAILLITKRRMSNND